MRPIDSYLVALLQKELRPEYGIVCNNFTLLQEDISTEVHLVMGNEEFSIIYSNEGDVHGNIRYAVKQFLINQKPYEYAMNEVKLRGLNETNLIELYFILKSIYEPRTIPGVGKNDTVFPEKQGVEVSAGLPQGSRGRPKKNA